MPPATSTPTSHPSPPSALLLCRALSHAGLDGTELRPLSRLDLRCWRFTWYFMPRQQRTSYLGKVSSLFHYSSQVTLSVYAGWEPATENVKMKLNEQERWKFGRFPGSGWNTRNYILMYSGLATQKLRLLWILRRQDRNFRVSGVQPRQHVEETKDCSLQIQSLNTIVLANLKEWLNFSTEHD